MAAGVSLTDRQRLDWLRLIRTETIGPRTFRGLTARFGSASAALDALPEVARKARRTIRICTAAEAEREFTGLTRLGARLIALDEPDYPAPLRAIETAPPLITVLGKAEALLKPCVAIVGSRNASTAGQKFAAGLARDLGEAGFTIVSGLARGIDTVAHRASLSTGTIAVMAGGLDKVYPPQNEALLQDLIGEGAALCEMPLGWVARGRDFPRRNRLVSGLSLGTVVVEAARRSGSLITARFANEQGRQVFAVPGSPLDPRAEGGNALIREGAILCAEAEHVIEALAPLIGRSELPHQPSLFRENGPEAGELWNELDQIAPPDDPVSAEPIELDPRGNLLTLLGPTPVSLDDLVISSGQPARAVSGMVLELELAGLVQRQPDGSWVRS